MSTASSSASPANSVVRNRIASLEAQRRAKVSSASPSSALSVAAASTSSTMMHRSPLRINKGSSGKDPLNTSQDSTRLSTTAAASRNRRSRLLRQTSSSPDTNNKTTDEQRNTNHRATTTTPTTATATTHKSPLQQRSLETRRLMGLANVPAPSPSSSYATSTSNVGPPAGPSVSLFAHHHLARKKQQQQQKENHQKQQEQEQQKEMERQERERQTANEQRFGKATTNYSTSNNNTTTATTRIGKIQRLRHMRAVGKEMESDSAAAAQEEEEEEEPEQPIKRPAPLEARVTSTTKTEAISNRSYVEPQHTPSWRAPKEKQPIPATPPPPPPPPQRHYVEEEKSNKSYANRIVLAPSSSSDYDSSRSQLHQQQMFDKQAYGQRQDDLQQQHQQNDLHRLLPQEPSMSTSQLTPDVAAFFDGRSTNASAANRDNQLSQHHQQHHHHSLYNNGSSNTAATNTMYSPKDRDDDTYDYSGQDEKEAMMYHQHHQAQAQRLQQQCHQHTNDNNNSSRNHGTGARVGARQQTRTATFDNTTPNMLSPTPQLRGSNTMDEDDDEDYHDHLDDYGNHRPNSNQHHSNGNNLACYNMRGNFNDQDTVDDDDDDGSVSYSRRTRQEQEAQLRQAAAAQAKADMSNGRRKSGSAGSLFVDTAADNNDSYVDSARKHMDTPAIQTAVGVAAAATAGCLLLGPVGLLVGAAAVGIGVGVLQIPPEQRENMQFRAVEACRGAQDHAMNMTEAISNSCANTYSDSGISDHVPIEMKQCCEAIDEEVTKVVQANGKVYDDSIEDDDDGCINLNAGSKTSNMQNGGVGDGNGIGGGKRAEGGNSKAGDSKSSLSPKRLRNKKDKIACLRDGPVIPVCQIHALDPVAQPRAWLDIMANADSAHEEKIEAMEEISILSKDKVRARIFLEEGVLDSLLWILGRYFEKLAYNKKIHKWANPIITKREAEAVKLAATCCLTLGKSHCASVHTGGDLLLMSLYERGTVPEERQLAQMFHEVPFHSRLTKPENDPTIIDPGNEMFAMKQLSLPQAEELAKKIAAIAGGQIKYAA